MALIALGKVPAIWAERHGSDTWAIRHGDNVISWGELEERSSRRAHALKGVGVGVGDLVRCPMDRLFMK